MQLITRFIIILGLGLVSVACANDATQTLAQDGRAQATQNETFTQNWPTIDPFQTLRFDNYSVTEGLSQSSALSLLQDSRGFLWVGTEDGLNRFDGTNFRIYRADPDDPSSLSNNYVGALAEDKNGNLWIGTYGGGLNRYDPDKETFTQYRADPQDPSSLSDNQVLSLHVDTGGRVWVGLRGEGLDRFDPVAESFIHYQHDPNNPNSLSQGDVLVLAEDNLGMLWVGTSGGLNRLDPDTGIITRYMHDPSDVDTPSADPILELYVDRFGSLWIGTVRGLDKFTPASERFEHYLFDANNPEGLSHPNVTSIIEDPAGGIWIGTENGLNYLNRMTRQFASFQHHAQDPASLIRNEIEDLLIDESGGLWVGTYGGGMSRTDPRRAAFSLYQAQPDEPNGLSESAIWSIFEDSSGILWIGTDGGGLDSFDRARGEWRHYLADAASPTSLQSDVVMGVYEDHLGALWISTVGGGLSRMDRETEEFSTYRNRPDDPSSISNDIVWFAREDNLGNLWVGTAWGLNRLDRETGKFTRHLHDPSDPNSLADNNVGSFLQDSSGTIWVGTHDGLNRLDPGNHQFQRYQHVPEDPQSLSHSIVFSIHEDTSGQLWFGTWGGGLNRYEPTTDGFTHYRVRDGLPNEVIYGIMEDAEGRLWLTTNNGLSRFDPTSESFVNFDLSDGLQSNEFSYNGYFQSPSGEMFVAGIDGFNAFNPAELGYSSFLPPIVLTSLTNEGQPIDLDGEVVLEWPANSLEFEYAALNYFQPEESQFAYRLSGFEQDWNYVGAQRFGRYTNLPGGDYTLQISGTNQDGVWNEAAASVNLRVSPPVWSSWWFIALVLVLVGSMAYGAFRLRIGAAENRSRELEEQVHQRTRALEEHSLELEKRGKELEALYQADEKLLRRLDLEEVLQALVDTAIEILEADKGGVLVWDPHSEELVVRASRGFAPQSFAAVRFVPGSGVAGRVFETGEPIAVEDTSREPRATRQLIEAEGINAFLQVPIKIGEEVYGVFSADYLEPRAFDQATIQLLISLASHAALAIDSARLYQEQKRRAEQFRVLNAVGSHVTSIMAIDELVCELVDLVQETFGYYMVEIGLIEGDDIVFKAGSGGPWNSDFESFKLKVGQEGISGTVAATGEAIMVRDVREEPRYLQKAATKTLSELVVPMKAKDKVIGVINIESDECCSFDDSDLVVFQSLADQAAIAIENAHLYEDTTDQVAQLTALQETTRALASTLELEGLLTLIVQQATSLLNADGGMINLVREVEHADEVVAAAGLTAGTVGARSDLDSSLSGWVTIHNEPVISNQVIKDPRVNRKGLESSLIAEIQSAAVAPLVVKNEVMGTLVLVGTSSGKGDFDETELQALVAFANQAAIAIENARLYSRAGRMAALEERARLARDLHDAVTQTLFSASLIAEALPIVWKEDPAEGDQLLQELRQLNRGALAEMRSLLMELRPAALESAELPDLMRQLGEAIIGRSGVEVLVATDGDCTVPTDVHVTIYRIAQEALNNIIKHAGATHVELTLSCNESDPAGNGAGKRVLELRVHDDGRGFDPTHDSSDGLGLKIIRERVESIGASLELESESGVGTTVVVLWEG
jgi:ligand-binding sensor domain-containing protein/signal transduction histidine kinase